MSRAFTREIDDAPLPPPPERVVSPWPNLVTPRGARLIERHVSVIEAEIAGTRDADALALLRRDLRYWSARRASMLMMPAPQKPAAIGFGVRATICRRGRNEQISVVGEDEADPAAGLIAWTAPLARALNEAEPGEQIDFEAGGRREEIEVVSIDGAAG